jgi:poly-beta-1,6-N-acetyl-D-glucosamine synthase
MIIIVGLYICLLLFMMKFNTNQEMEFEETKSISVLIPYRNEEEGLSALIQELEKQWQPAYGEIIFIDDHSTDGSRQIVLASSLSNMSLLSLNEGEGKKAALKYALAKVKFNHVAQVDADTIVSPDYFEKLLVKRADYTTGLIRYTSERSLINLYQRWENLAMMFTTRLAIQLKIPLMSNGANSNYKTKHVDYNDKYASGDDLFNMYSIFEAGGTIAFNDQTWVETKCAPDFKSFFNQRMRWMKKSGGLSDFKFRLLSVLLLISQLSPFYIFFDQSYEFIFLVVVKLLLELIGMMSINRKLKYKGLFPFYFVMVLLYPIAIILLLLISFFSSVSWKGRRL